jgi:hypothetical protein
LACPGSTLETAKADTARALTPSTNALPPACRMLMLARRGYDDEGPLSPRQPRIHQRIVHGAGGRMRGGVLVRMWQSRDGVARSACSCRRPRSAGRGASGLTGADPLDGTQLAMT